MRTTEYQNASGQQNDRSFLEQARILEKSRRLREKLHQERIQRQHKKIQRQLYLVQSSLIKAQSHLLCEHYSRLLTQNKVLNLEFQYLLKTECLSTETALHPHPPFQIQPEDS